MLIILAVIALYWDWGRACRRVKIGDDYQVAKAALLAEYPRAMVNQTVEGEDVRVSFACWLIRRSKSMCSGNHPGKIVRQKFIRLTVCGRWHRDEGRYLDPATGVKTVRNGFSGE